MQSLTDQFLTFCRSKPADEGYDYIHNDECAFGLFLTASGYSERPMVASDGWRDNAGVDHPLPFDDDILSEEPWTFGALADRLEAAIARAKGLEL